MLDRRCIGCRAMVKAESVDSHNIQLHCDFCGEYQIDHPMYIAACETAVGWKGWLRVLDLDRFKKFIYDIKEAGHIARFPLGDSLHFLVDDRKIFVGDEGAIDALFDHTGTFSHLMRQDKKIAL